MIHAAAPGAERLEQSAGAPSVSDLDAVYCPDTAPVEEAELVDVGDSECPCVAPVQEDRHDQDHVRCPLGGEGDCLVPEDARPKRSEGTGCLVDAFANVH